MVYHVSSDEIRTVDVSVSQVDHLPLHQTGPIIQE